MPPQSCLVAVPSRDSRFGSWGQCLEKTSDPLLLSDLLFHDEIDQIEGRSNEIWIAFEVHFTGVNGIVPRYPKHIEGLLRIHW